MGTVRSVTTTTTVAETRSFSPLRLLEAAVSGVLLVLALPLIGVLAVAVSRSSHGPVLNRERTRDRRGQAVELLSFRTSIDGSGTTHHERLRAVVGAGDAGTVTAVGRLMLATRTHRLPRLLNVVRGHCSLRAL